MGMSWAERLAGMVVIVAIAAHFSQFTKKKDTSKTGLGQAIPEDEEPGYFVGDDDDDVISGTTDGAGTSSLDRLGLARIFVLRVERAKHRSKALEQDAASLKLPLEFFTATDGVTNKSWRSKIIPSLGNNGTCGNIIGAIFDTHQSVWKIAAESRKPTLVVEDDIRLPSNFVELWEERMKELPRNFNMAFVGGAVHREVGVLPHSKHVSKLAPARNDWGSPLLGFWGYVLSPQGAQKLLKLVWKERIKDGWRHYQPVDLFVAKRNQVLGNVFVFESPPEMKSEFERNPDRHHVIESHRQIGIVSLAKNVESLNQPAKSPEQEEMDKLLQDQVRLGEAGHSLQAWQQSLRSFQRMRRYSCWGAAALQRNAGLTVLNILEKGQEQQAFPKGLPSLPGLPKQPLDMRALALALEFFASSIRYNGGTWLALKHTNEIPGWIRHMIFQRNQNGFGQLEIARLLPKGKQLIDLPGGVKLDPMNLVLYDPLPSKNM